MEGYEQQDYDQKGYVTADATETPNVDLIEAPLPEGTIDPVYETKARVLNAAVSRP